MNFSLKPHPLIAHWVPGMVVLMPLVLSHFNWCYTNFVNEWAGSASAAGITVLLLSVGAFLIGEVLDSGRDCFIEMLLDWFGGRWPKKEEDWPIIRYLRPIKLNWAYFSPITLTAEKAGLFDDYYWTYYVLDMNLFGALILSMILKGFACITVPSGYSRLFWLVMILSSVILSADALLLRHEAGLNVMNKNAGEASPEAEEQS